jgi:progressive ankylosis protein
VRPDDRSARAILALWLPLAAQWLMMALEGPFLAAVIARMAEPAFNLAAYGIAFAFAILVESPVIMLMSAATALVSDARSYRRLRNFGYALCGVSTALLLLVLVPGVFSGLMEDLLALPPEVSELVRGSLWLLLPWPAAIGYRRFLHGVMIRSGRARLVAYGTGLRLVAMASVAILLARLDVPGAWVGASALSAGVLVEALATRWMAAGAVRELLGPERRPRASVSRASVPAGDGLPMGGGAVAAVSRGSGEPVAEPTTTSYLAIARFYYPLALTSLISLTVQPLLTFFMGRSPAPVTSLAVFPVVHALSFFFNALALSFQEAAIALLGPRCEHVRPLARFAAGLAVVASAGLALVAFTPLAGVWFATISGLPPELAAAAVLPARILVVLPALSVVLSLQRAILVQQRRTRPITYASAIEIATIAVLFPVLGWGLGWKGVVAAVSAFVVGRAMGVGFLIQRARSTLQDPDGGGMRTAPTARRNDGR